MAGLRTILIDASQIKCAPKWMRDTNNNYDLMGQILKGLGISVHKHTETPAHQNTVAFPFTEAVRGRSNNTPLTMRILANSVERTPRKQIELANDLLEDYDIYLEEL